MNPERRRFGIFVARTFRLNNSTVMMLFASALALTTTHVRTPRVHPGMSRAAVAMQMPKVSIPDWLSAAAFPMRGTPTQAVLLRDLLVAGGADSEQVDPLIEALATLRVPCTNLGAGLWRASYVQGPTPLWEKARALPFLRNSNVAGQTYDVTARTVVNYAELTGPSLHFVVQGVFSEVRVNSRCPKDFNVQATQGGLVVGGTPFLTSAISGPGYLRVLYVDDDVRIFASPNDSPGKVEEAGLVVVQVRDGCFG